MIHAVLTTRDRLRIAAYSVAEIFLCCCYVMIGLAVMILPKFLYWLFCDQDGNRWRCGKPIDATPVSFVEIRAEIGECESERVRFTTEGSYYQPSKN